MKKITFVFLLGAVMASASVSAEWLKLGASGRSVFYIDPATVQTVLGHRQAWDLWDVTAEVEEDESSRLTLREFDCVSGRFRVLAFSEYPARMGRGPALLQNRVPGGWQFAEPNTLPMLSLRQACGS